MRLLLRGTMILGFALAACAAPPSQQTPPSRLIVVEKDRKAPDGRDGGIGGTSVRTTGVLGAITGCG